MEGHQIAAVAFVEALFRGEAFFAPVEGLFDFQHGAVPEEDRDQFVLGLQIFDVPKVEIAVAVGCPRRKMAQGPLQGGKPAVQYLEKPGFLQGL